LLFPENIETTTHQPEHCVPDFLHRSLDKHPYPDRVFDQIIWVVPTSRIATLFEYELSKAHQNIVPPKIMTWS